ncbi:MAG: hypothetical protein ACYC2H_01040 [Thermoplasmatota archaeon]
MARRPPKSPELTIDTLHPLDSGGSEWEWSCGAYDFHAHFAKELGCWILEQFDSGIQDPETAHLDEQECESFEDALLFSLDATRWQPPPGGPQT